MICLLRPEAYKLLFDYGWFSGGPISTFLFPYLSNTRDESVPAAGNCLYEFTSLLTLVERFTKVMNVLRYIALFDKLLGPNLLEDLLLFNQVTVALNKQDKNLISLQHKWYCLSIPQQLLFFCVECKRAELVDVTLRSWVLLKYVQGVHSTVVEVGLVSADSGQVALVKAYVETEWQSSILRPAVLNFYYEMPTSDPQEYRQRS